MRGLRSPERGCGSAPLSGVVLAVGGGSVPASSVVSGVNRLCSSVEAAGPEPLAGPWLP